MTDQLQYIPILKAKAGEFEGLYHLSAGTKSCLTPLIEVQPIPLKYDGQPGVATGQKLSLDQHLKKVTERIP